MKILLQATDYLEEFNERVGRFASYFSAALVLIIGLEVVLRYVFGVAIIWVGELKTYFFAIIFLLGAAAAFKHDRHVRVDVFYSRLSERGKAWINLIGGVLLLMPWCVVVWQVAFRYAYHSWLIQESSPQAGGLPALYILKFIILLGFMLLTSQALVSIIKSLNIIRTSTQ